MTALEWQALTSEELAREYSPSSCIPDIAPHIAAYVERSQAARDWCALHGHPITELRYGPKPSNTIDLVTPAEPDAPLLVFVHGGYWQELSKRESFFAAADAVTAGVGFAALDYTLAPHASLDEIVVECTTALHTLHTAAADHGIDPERIIVAGSSAGAHLAAMVGVRAIGWEPAALVLVSGVFDLEPIIHTYVNDALQMDRTAAVRNSPLFETLDGVAPSLVCFGDNETDQFKRQSQTFAAALRAVGGIVHEFEVSERNHFDVILDLFAEDTELGVKVRRLVNATDASAEGP